MRARSQSDLIKIFFSHNVRDAPVTKSLVEIIEHHTENIQCFTSEDMEKGTDWRKTIAEHLALASVLVVVFTDPGEDWGSVLYETGFFDSLVQERDATNSRRMYCLQNPSVVPPPPIANMQSVLITPNGLSAWLEDLFTYTKQTKAGFWSKIPRIVSEIGDLFIGERKPRYSILVPTMTILLKDTMARSAESVLLAQVEADNYALKLLNLRPTYSQWTLEDIKRVQSDRLWLNELIDNVLTISNGQDTSPARHVLHTSHGDFIPTISRLVRETDTQLNLTVDLVELPKEARTEAFF